MQDQAHQTQKHVNTNDPSQNMISQEIKQILSQKYVMDFNFNQDPFWFYHPYWALQNQLYFYKSYLNSGAQNWSNQLREEQPKMEIEHLRRNQEKSILHSNTVQMDLDSKDEGEDKNRVEKKMQPKRKQKIQKSRCRNHGSTYWSVQQNKRYANFLSNNIELFGLSLNKRKTLKVNVKMSKKVKSRTPQQCHSHHQKMMKKHGSIIRIIQTLQLLHVQQQKNAQNREQVNKVQIQAKAKNDDNCLKVEVNC